jgi:hypothetical protein
VTTLGRRSGRFPGPNTGERSQLPNTAIRRGFTRPISVLSIAAASFLAASGCSDSPVAPSPQPPSPPATLTTVTLEGRVLDEQNQPVEGARITLTHVHPTGPIANFGGTAPRVTADDTGHFTLNLELPANWQQVTLRVDREGYESDTRIWFVRAAPRALLISLYRSLTISPGESIQTTVSLPSFACWLEESPCRRVSVNAPSGKLVDIEVIPEDGQEDVGLAVGNPPRPDGLPRQVTVSGGDDVWIVNRLGQLGRVTLRAAGR